MLKTILSISGKPGLYKLISQGKGVNKRERKISAGFYRSEKSDSRTIA